MAIGERIRYIRNLRGMTQKYLGMAIGFSEKTADVRMAQYESGSRTPKEKMIADLAYVLEVSPLALTIPDIDTHLGLIHTLFALEDMYGITVSESDGEVCIRLDKTKGGMHDSIFRMVKAWQQEAAKFEAGEITKEEYDKWRYKYPEFDTTQRWAKVPSDMINDAFLKQYKKKFKDL